MIKIDYNFRAISPLHTGSDTNAGTLRTLRRQACISSAETSYTSCLADEDRRNAVVNIAFGIWKAIDFDNIKGRRLMGIWDEFYNKLLAAGRSSNKYQFLETLCRSWGIQNIKDQSVLEAINIITDEELLETVRSETIFICLKTRALKEMLKRGSGDLFSAEQIDKENGHIKYATIEPREIKKTRDFIPCISGNSIRGKLRRLAMYDFCKRAGVKSLRKNAYHILFSGGFLDSSTAIEDIELMEKYICMCPTLGLLGSAIGNMTIEGEMKVGWAYPLCIERGTGDYSYWRYLDVVFQTRKDSSKTEKVIELTKPSIIETKKGADATKKINEKPQQMKYKYEVFADNTPFEHKIVCTSDDSLLVSAFWHIMGLYSNNPYLGGMGAVGNGEIKFDMDIPESANTEYIEHITDNAESIKECWV